MNSKQNLILSLDDLVLNLPQLKDSLWKNVLVKHQVEVHPLFNELSFDANSEKIEKLSREYPRFAPYFEEVNQSYKDQKLDYLKTIKINPQALNLFEKLAQDFDISFLTNLSLEEFERTNLLSHFNFKPKAVFSTKEVLNGKPDADIYLKIARIFNVKPQKLITIDATINGVQAGYLANTKAIYVSINYPISQWAMDYSIAFLNGFDELENTLYNWLKDQSV